jgi:cellulose synthase/poly-beta-1,6-N-acetylglucosamine synthase-like glycosyltransferase
VEQDIAPAASSATASEMAALCLARLFLPTEGRLLTADLSAENLGWLRAAYPGATPEPVSRQALLAAIRARFGADLLDEAVSGLARKQPRLSARRVLSNSQAACLIWGMLAGGLLVAAAPLAVLRAAIAVLSLAFVAGGLFRALLALFGARRPVPLAPSRVALPSYTILVPLYREAAILPALAQALAALDYPRARLDVLLAIEQDDAETLCAARALGLEIVEVPPGGPRTKPKAANYALQFARGEYVVVYDAEDRPEPDQLLKAVAAFRSLPRKVACVQARLNFYNVDCCWLTRMFALDYALWFDVLLPGLDRIGMPMPLGGTSNHFRTAVLRDIGAWDAYNVTEDADIGIRLAQMGYRVAMLDSTTFEEAPLGLHAWLKQRSRWLKGYMQTWLVHMRDPAGLWRRTGFGGFLALQLFIGGGIVFALANPLLWGAMAACALLHVKLWDSISAAWIPGYSLLLNNLLLTALAVIGPRRRGWDELSPYGLTVIAYWALISAAGYRGLWQLITRPFYWEKTTHGESLG